MSRILLFDIETSPSKAFIWELYNEVTSMEMVDKEWYTLCWSAKWLGEKKVMCSALPDFKLYNTDKTDDSLVMEELWKLLDQADIVIAHNAVKFDVRKVNARFIMNGFTPPSPYKILDTLKVARRYFSFMSNRLGDLGKFLKVGGKMDTGGFKLWKGCLDGDKKCWSKMVKYCKADVVLLEKIYEKMRPYIKIHPSKAIHNRKELACPKCGSTKTEKRGTRVVTAGLNQEFCCKDCGGWAHIRIRNWTKEERQRILKNG